MVVQTWARWRNWWQQQNSAEQWSWLAVMVATVLGSTYRLTNITNTLQFLADQGRDALIAYQILHGDVALVGPSTSVGSMYLGPFYYYFMAPWLLLGNYNPLAPALAVSIIGIATIPLLYWVGKLYVGRGAAVVAALLYASAPVVSEYVRFSWNPNISATLTLLILWTLHKAWRADRRWWIVVSLLFSVLLQLHYVGLLMAAPLGCVWLADIWRVWKKRSAVQAKSLFWISTVSLGVLLASFLPLVVFDWKFQGIIRQGFAEFFFQSRQLSAPADSQNRWWQVLRETEGRGLLLFFEIWGKEWGSYYRVVNQALLYSFIGVWLWWASARLRSHQFETSVLLFTALTSAFGLALYRSSVYFHYIAFFFPVAYLLTGVVIVKLSQALRGVFLLPAAALFIYIALLSVLPTQLLYLRSLGWTVVDYRSGAERILAELPQEKTYTLAQLSDIRDYRGLSYRYFLTMLGRPPVAYEQASQADVLVIVAEKPIDPVAVITSPVYEISAFPKGTYRYVDIPNGPRLFFVERMRE